MDNMVKDSDPLEETLFFYPIIGLLNDLAFNISKIKIPNNG